MLINAIQGGFASFDFRTFFVNLLLSILPFMLALSAHEAAHGWVANRCGDPTAKILGRVTLNPLSHIDPIGFAMLFLVGFGWAKPVPVNPNNFRNYRKDDLKVSLAGIAANLMMFVIGCILMYGMIAFALSRIPASSWDSAEYFIVRVSDLKYKISISETFLYSFQMGDYLIGPYLGTIASYLYEMLLIFVSVNLVLALFNLIPVPPLDGYHVLNDLLLKRPLFAPQQAAMIGQIVLIVLVVSGAISNVLGTVIDGTLHGAGVLFESLFRALRLV